MKALEFDTHWVGTAKKGSHYTVRDNKGLIADYVETQVDSVILTRKEVEELVGNAFNAGKLHQLELDGSIQTALSKQQYISSIIKPQK